MRSTFLILCVTGVILLSGGACTSRRQSTSSSFISVEKGQFIRDGKPYQYVGANFWYGAILASQGEGGNRVRLAAELDSLKEIGVDNLRILVGSDGQRGVLSKVEPTLQVAPGVYNDTLFDGLDYLLAEMGKRKMVAVLYLNNSWEWSGGYSQYLEWAGEGKAPIPHKDGWETFMEYVSRFPRCKAAQEIFAGYVEHILTRINRYTNIKYVDDPAIMSWQIGNEPRAFAEGNKEPFARWMAEVAALIKSLDKNHLVSSGSEGKWGCEGDIELYEKIHSDSNIDYLTIHIWPYNWGWVKGDSLVERLPLAKENTRQYINEHLEIARTYNKPLVLEEFGFPRDGMQFSQTTPTMARDEYYEFIFNLIRESRRNDGLFAGCNFWAWGGLARQAEGHIFWQRGDDYTGDPAQEEQGLNSVFMSDSTTIDVIRKYVKP